MPITVRKCSMTELRGEANFSALVAEYAAECAIDGLPPAGEKLAAYDFIEASGIFQAYGAFDGEMLVGFCAVMTPIIPHYGVGVTVTESIFVGSAHRHTGAGIKLMLEAAHHAREAKSPGILFSAPSGGVLAEVLAKSPGYRETNRVFFKEFEHE